MKEGTADGHTASYLAWRSEFTRISGFPETEKESLATSAALLAADNKICLDGDPGINGRGEQEGRAARTAQGRGCSRPSISGFRIHRLLTGRRPPGTGLWAVTTDTQTNQELSLKPYQLDKVTGDRKTGYWDTAGVCPCSYMCVCVCVRMYAWQKDIKSKKLQVHVGPAEYYQSRTGHATLRFRKKKKRRQTDMLIIANLWILQLSKYLNRFFLSLTSTFFSNKRSQRRKTKRMIMSNIAASTDLKMGR